MRLEMCNNVGRMLRFEGRRWKTCEEESYASNETKFMLEKNLPKARVTKRLEYKRRGEETPSKDETGNRIRGNEQKSH